MTINDKCIENFCKNIKLLRTRHSFTQKEMARILGIGIKSLRKLEKGIMPHLLRANVLVVINDVFGITPDAMGQRNNKNPTAYQ